MIQRWIREFGGAQVDLFAASERAEAIAARLVAGGMAASKAQREAARQVVCAVLIGQIRDGDRAASDQLVSICVDDVFRWCRFHGHRSAMAEDLSHDALVRMLDQLPKLRDPDRFRPWLWSVVWRVCQEHWRRSRWRRWLPGLGGRCEDLDQVVHAAEREAKVAGVLQRLADDDRTLLFLAYVEEQTRKDIAALLSVPEGTLNRRLSAARAAFAELATAAGLDGGTDLVRAWEET